MTDLPDRRFLVTGAYGCVGAWVTRELAAAGADVTTFDLSTDPRRLAMLLDAEALAAIPHQTGDISDLDTVERVVSERGITNVIHLAALQVPFCRADPPLGARVNVLGTVNVFEAVRRSADHMAPLVYASSVAAFDAYEEDTPPAMSGHPGTIYGVYKRANESTAWLYAEESGVASVGLRPHTVYGVGRDQGLTSAPTTAMLAAAAGVPFTIPYGGASQLQLASDVARAFVSASVSDTPRASVHNLPSGRVEIAEVIAAIEAAAPASAGTIEATGTRLPFPEEVASDSFAEIDANFKETPLADGVGSTIERFRELLAEGLVAPPTAAP
jgi:nucleoside-diphosphate-sugar epimerase